MILTQLKDLQGFIIGERLLHKMRYAHWHGDGRMREKKTKEIRDKVVNENQEGN